MVKGSILNGAYGEDVSLVRKPDDFANGSPYTTVVVRDTYDGRGCPEMAEEVRLYRIVTEALNPRYFKKRDCVALLERVGDPDDPSYIAGAVEWLVANDGITDPERAQERIDELSVESSDVVVGMVNSRIEEINAGVPDIWATRETYTQEEPRPEDPMIEEEGNVFSLLEASQHLNDPRPKNRE